MIKHLLLVFIFIAFISAVSGQSEQLRFLVPEGFTILDSASGDINQMGEKTG